MNPGEIVEALKAFFLDIIGHVFPGVALIVGLSLVLDLPFFLGILGQMPALQSVRWLLLIAGGYVVGHLLIAAGERVVVVAVAWAADRLRRWRLTSVFVPNSWVSRETLKTEIANSEVFKAAVEKLQQTRAELRSLPATAGQVHPFRNLAMTVMSTEEKQLVYRFMFISLFNVGMATVGFFLLSVWILVRTVPLNIWWPVLLVVSLLFLDRYFEFYARALRLPFPVALTRLRSDEPIKSIEPTLKEIIKEKQRLLVYLAGGLRSNWQDRIRAAVPTFGFFDPRSHGLTREEEYTLWDLQAIRECDLVFAYLEERNPGGYSLALEVGYAKALGKRIILVDEKSDTDSQTARYLGMIRVCSDVVLDSIEQGVEFMQRLETLN